MSAAEWGEERTKLAHSVVIYSGGFDKEVQGVAVRDSDVDHGIEVDGELPRLARFKGHWIEEVYTIGNMGGCRWYVAPHSNISSTTVLLRYSSPGSS